MPYNITHNRKQASIHLTCSMDMKSHILAQHCHTERK